MEKYYKIITLGCKVNAYESEAMSQQLEQLGYRHSEECNPSIIVVNTCSVTSTSDGKSRQMINRYHKLYPNALIIVTGCYSQMASKVVGELDGVGIVIGTEHRSEIGKLISEYYSTGQKVVKVRDSARNIENYEELEVTSYNDNTRAFLKIQDGCNNFCSYCIIPYARGPLRSRNRDDVIKEAKKLVESGFKEIVLTGIHTAGYGQDFKDYSFTDLLKDLLKEVKDLKRIRISSIEESEITDELIELIKNEPRIVSHLHIPLQSGCDTVLKRMNRKYITEEFYNKIVKIKSAIDNIAITTDVIVGFPGESEEEFKITYDFIKKVNFASLHVFPYSRRSGTVADRMPNQIDGNIKKQRVKELISLSNDLANKYASSCLNKTYDVLFETYDEKSKTVVGHTPNYLKVECLGDESVLNTIKSVIIEESGYPLCKGKII